MERAILTRFSLASGIRSLYINRSLLRSLVIRDIQTRYRGTIFGFMWALVYPLMMLAVYTFVFGGVFNARWGSDGDMKDFVLMLYCGLIVHAVFSETLTRSPAAIVSNPSYVKKVVFPLELLTVGHLASAAFNALIGLVLLCLFLLIQYQSIPFTAFYVPLVFAPVLVLIVGLASCSHRCVLPRRWANDRGNHVSAIIPKPCVLSSIIRPGVGTKTYLPQPADLSH
jgi:lipopolysaccharide transport system permease protein